MRTHPQAFTILVLTAAHLLSFAAAQCHNENLGYTQTVNNINTGTNTEGQYIGSDATYATHYTDNRNCAWRLTCDPGQFAGLSRTRTEMRDANDILTFNDGSTSFFTINNARDTGARRTIFSNTNILDLTFVSDASNSDRNGFEGYLRCFPSRCPDGRDDSVTIAAPYTLATDQDGQAGSARNAINADCTWLLQCPVGQFLAYTGTSNNNNLGNHEIMTFRDGSNTVISRSYDNTDEPRPGERIIGTGNTGSVKLVSGLPTNGQNQRGVTLNVECLTLQCTIEATTTITTFPHTFQSDADGSAAGTLISERGENCDITVQCPVGQFGTYTYTGDISGTGNLVELQTAASAQIVQFTSSATGSRWVHNSNEYKVLYQTSASGTDSLNGFTLTADCLASQCPAYGGANPITSFPITLQSDADGEAGGTTYANGESCDITIQCPVGMLAKITYLVSSADANDAFEVLDSGSSTVIGPLSGALSGGEHFAVDEVLRLRWSSNLDGVVGDGWSATLTCAITSCATDPPINQAFLHRPTSLKVFQYVYVPKSTVVCSGSSVTAGQRMVCTVTIQGPCGDSYGDNLDMPMIALSACPREPHKTNGDTGTLTYHNSTFITGGQYQFEVWPRAAGVTNVTVSIGNPIYTIPSHTSFFVHPGDATPAKSTTECTIDETGYQQCVITHRDALGNARQKCDMRQQGDLHSTAREECSFL